MALDYAVIAIWTIIIIATLIRLYVHFKNKNNFPISQSFMLILISLYFVVQHLATLTVIVDKNVVNEAILHNTSYTLEFIIFLFSLYLLRHIYKSTVALEPTISFERSHRNDSTNSSHTSDLNKLYEAVSSIKTLLNTTKDTTQIFEKVVTTLTSIDRYDVAFITLSNKENKSFKVKSFRDISELPFKNEEAILEAIQSDKVHEDPAVATLHTTQTVVISKPLEEISLQHAHSKMKFSGVKSVLAFSLSSSIYQSPLGSLCLYGLHEVERGSEEVAILEELMSLVASTISMIQADKLSQLQAIELIEKNALLEKIIETVPARIFWKDRQLKYQGCNAFFAKDAQSTPPQIIGKNDHDLVWSDEASDYSADDHFVIDNDKNIVNRIEKQGEKWMLTNKAPFKNDRGEIIGVVGVYVDVTLQKLAEDYLRENEKRFRELLELIPNVAISGCNSAYEVIYWNKQCEKVYGYSAKEAMGKRIDSLIFTDTYKREYQMGVDAWISDNKVFEGGTQVMRDKKGAQLEINASHILLNRLSSYPEIFNIDIDVTEEKIAQRKLVKLANFDLLTTLPNRYQLHQHIHKLIQHSQEKGEQFALFFMDMDNFKYINDAYGHRVGDLLLKAVALRLKNSIREHDFIARFGGDEFITLVRFIDKKVVVDVAQVIVNEMKKEFLIEDKKFYITLSIGITYLNNDNLNDQTLLSQADSAMYQAKKNGKNSINFFDMSMHSAIKSHMEIELLLREAIKRGDLQMYYQPQVSFSTGNFNSCEALIRWQEKSTNNFIPPDIFLPIAEQAHLMDEISKFVIVNTLQTLHAWQNNNIELVRLDINLPAYQVYNPVMIEFLLKNIEHYGVDAKYLGVEITEGQMLNLNDNNTLENLNLLKDQGINLSIDDFGTGYSSLSYLMQFEVNHIKIDKAFILNLDSEQNQVLVKSIIAMTHALGYSVVAEGVETDAQKEFLQRHECNLAQGFGYHKPMPVDEIKLLLEHKKK